MEVELPSGGCSILSGYNSLDHYLNGTRIRYYIYDGKLVRSSSSTYTRLPDNSYCLQSGDLVYKPEIPVYFSFMSMCIVAFAGISLYNIMIKKLWQGK